ncbi:MAG: hypothetical protein ACOYMB_04155 [Patescibacteria group bacterium]
MNEEIDYFKAFYDGHPANLEKEINSFLSINEGKIKIVKRLLISSAGGGIQIILGCQDAHCSFLEQVKVFNLYGDICTAIEDLNKTMEKEKIKVVDIFIWHMELKPSVAVLFYKK